MMLTMLLKQNSDDAYEASFAKAKLLGGFYAIYKAEEGGHEAAYSH
jgi:hypothetical protein